MIKNKTVDQLINEAIRKDKGTDKNKFDTSTLSPVTKERYDLAKTYITEVGYSESLKGYKRTKATIKNKVRIKNLKDLRKSGKLKTADAINGFDAIITEFKLKLIVYFRLNYTPKEFQEMVSGLTFNESLELQRQIQKTTATDVITSVEETSPYYNSYELYVWMTKSGFMTRSKNVIKSVTTLKATINDILFIKEHYMMKAYEKSRNMTNEDILIWKSDEDKKVIQESDMALLFAIIDVIYGLEFALEDIIKFNLADTKAIRNMKYVITQIKKAYDILRKYIDFIDGPANKLQRDIFYRKCEELKGYKYKWLVRKAFDSVDSTPTIEEIIDYKNYIKYLQKKRKLKSEIELYN